MCVTKQGPLEKEVQIPNIEFNISIRIELKSIDRLIFSSHKSINYFLINHQSIHQSLILERKRVYSKQTNAAVVVIYIYIHRSLLLLFLFFFSFNSHHRLVFI
jgi:hypothetical protein